MKTKLMLASSVLFWQSSFAMEVTISAEDVFKAACKLINLYGGKYGFSTQSDKYKDNVVSILLNRDESKKNGDSITFFVPCIPYANDRTIFTNMRGKESVIQTKIPEEQIKAINDFIDMIVKARKQRTDQARMITKIQKDLVFQQIKQAQKDNDEELEAELNKKLEDLNEHLVFQVGNFMLKWKTKTQQDDLTFIHGSITNIDIDKYAPKSITNCSPRAIKQKK